MSQKKAALLSKAATSVFHIFSYFCLLIALLKSAWFLSAGEFAGPIKAVGSIAMNEGAKGFFAGYGSFLLRDLPFDALEFVLYEQLKRTYQASLKGRKIKPVETSVLGRAHSASCCLEELLWKDSCANTPGLPIIADIASGDNVLSTGQFFEPLHVIVLPCHALQPSMCSCPVTHT